MATNEGDREPTAHDMGHHQGQKYEFCTSHDHVNLTQSTTTLPAIGAYCRRNSRSN